MFGMDAKKRRQEKPLLLLPSCLYAIPCRAAYRTCVGLYSVNDYMSECVYTSWFIRPPRQLSCISDAASGHLVFVDNEVQRWRNSLLFLVGAELLNIDSVLHLESLQNRRLVVLLTCAQLLNNTCLFEFSLELLESSFDVLTIFYWYNNHFVFFCLFGYTYSYEAAFAANVGAKLLINCELAKFLRRFLHPVP